MKDFATKRARVDGQVDQTRFSQNGIPIGRWILLSVTVLIMVAYAIWSHHRSPSALQQPPKTASHDAITPSNAKAAADASASPLAADNDEKSLENSKKNQSLSALPPPPVQFDFYHVLANDSGNSSGNSSPKLELLKPSPPPEAVSDPSKHIADAQKEQTFTNTKNRDEQSETVGTASHVSSAAHSSTNNSQPPAETPLSPDKASNQDFDQASDQVSDQAGDQVSHLSHPESKNISESSPKNLKPQKIAMPEKVPDKSVEKTPLKLSSPKAATKAVAPLKTETKIQIYDVHVATFLIKDRAEAMRGKLMLLGFEPKISTDMGRYRLHFPGIKNLHNAELLQAQLAKSGISASINSSLVPAGSMTGAGHGD